MHYHFQMPSLTHTFYASAYIIVGGEHYVFGLSLWPSVSACVHLSSRCPLTPVPLDTISACCVEGFEWNLAQVFIMWKLWKRFSGSEVSEQSDNTTVYSLSEWLETANHIEHITDVK